MPNDRAEFTSGNGHDAGALTRQEFARRFQASGRLLWVVAAGVLGEPSEADDVLQEAGMMALTKLNHYQPGTNFQAWMAQFVRNVALNHGRRMQRRRPQALESGTLEELPAQSPGRGQGSAPMDPLGELAADQMCFDDEVQAGLRSLSAAQRSCLLLRSVMELSYKEIAETLSIPEGTAMSHVHRGRALMRERLSDGSPADHSIEEFG